MHRFYPLYCRALHSVYLITLVNLENPVIYLFCSLLRRVIKKCWSGGFMSKETMSLDEKLEILYKSYALEDAGDVEGAKRLKRSVPMPPYLAMIAKKTVGADFLIKGGWNSSEAEAEFGSDWLLTKHG